MDVKLSLYRLKNYKENIREDCYPPLRKKHHYVGIHYNRVVIGAARCDVVTCALIPSVLMDGTRRALPKLLAGLSC